MKKPKLREVVEAVKAIFTGPYTPKEFITPPENLRARARFSEEDCIGCGACVEVCPANCILLEDDLEHDPPVRRLTVRSEQCIVCGQCERYCTTDKGIQLTPEYDLATFEPHQPIDTVEKELMLCERCGEVIGCVDHLKWIARKIGPKTYASPSLLAAMDPQHRSGGAKSQKGASDDRSDLMRALCTSCRRQVLAAEVWG
ncbi:MAG TPA: 4Fe-4S dicluster domain-containing protein [Planctomycetota bacterium]|nr:4Fe-4S dicluster domain-containing protein [Planctomycetota bacterium]